MIVPAKYAFLKKLNLGRIQILLSLAISLPLSTLSFAAEDPVEVSVYTYDSLVAKGGLGPEIFPLFEKNCGCKLKVSASGDGGQLLTRLQLDAERGKSSADLVLGIDQVIWERAKPWLDTSATAGGAKMKNLETFARVAPGFVPFDYSEFAFMMDKKGAAALGLKAPKSLSDLQKPEWKRNLILEDPRTSTPGLAFLLYTRALLGDSVWDFWRTFKTQWLMLAPGWDGAYGLFMKNEAPLVWSYTTSQAYHEAHGDSSGADRRYEAVLFDEGEPVQVEGGALVKPIGAGNPERRAKAEAFLEFLLSDEVQNKVALKNWMRPVIAHTKLPDSFTHLPTVKKRVAISQSADFVEASLKQWSKVVSE
jgi:thiamine transport system substrate-binding protein